MSAEYDKFQNERDRLVAETQASMIKHLSFEVFAKTDAEKTELKDAKARYKSSL